MILGVQPLSNAAYQGLDYYIGMKAIAGIIPRGTKRRRLCREMV